MSNQQNTYILLILLVLFIILHFLFIKQKYQYISTQNIIHFPYKIQIKTYQTEQRCLFYYYSVSFELDECSSLEEGSELEIYGRLRQEDDKQFFNNKRLIVQGISRKRTHDGSVKDWFLAGLNMFLLSIQTQKTNLQAVLGEKEGSLVIGLLLANPAFIDQSTRLNLQKAGLSYLLHTTSLNALLLFECLCLFLPLRHKKSKKCILLLSSVLYLLISGFSSSLVRFSSFYLADVVASLILKRAFLPFYGLVLSVALILTIYPLYFFDFSFQISLVANLGINFFRYIELPRSQPSFALTHTIVPMLYLYAFLLPLLFLYFGEFNLLSVFSGPLVSLWILPLLLLGSIYIIFQHFTVLSFFAFSYLKIASQIFFKQIDFWSQFPPHQFELPIHTREFIVISWYLCLVAFLFHRLKEKRKNLRYEIV
jgi:hypothetical protein